MHTAGSKKSHPGHCSKDSRLTKLIWKRKLIWMINAFHKLSVVTVIFIFFITWSPTPAERPNECQHTIQKHMCPGLQACIRSSAITSSYHVKTLISGQHLWCQNDESIEEHKVRGPGSDLHRRISEPYSPLWFHLFIRCLHQDYTRLIQKKNGAVESCAAVHCRFLDQKKYTYGIHMVAILSQCHRDTLKSLSLFENWFEKIHSAFALMLWKVQTYSLVIM